MLPHERTMPKAKSDRLALIRATRANLDPIWGLTPATGPAGRRPAMPVAETTDDLGVQHSLTPDHRRRDRSPRSAGSSVRRRSCSPTATTGSRPAIAYRNERTAAGDAHRRRRPGHVPRGRARRRPALGAADPPPARRRRRSRRRCGPALGAGFAVEDLGPNDAGRRRAARAPAARRGRGRPRRRATGWPGWSPTPARSGRGRPDLPDVLHEVPSAWFDELAAPALERRRRHVPRRRRRPWPRWSARARPTPRSSCRRSRSSQIRAAALAGHAHAAEDDLLRAEAAQRPRLPPARRGRSRPSSLPRRSGRR